MSRRLFLHLLVPAIFLLACYPAMAENRLALVIGQSAYRSVPALPNPANDAQAMTRLLSDSGFEVSAASDLSQDQLREKVSEFASQVAARGPDTVALVFYAGHGLQIDGENYLIPVDIDVKREADIPIQAVRLNDVLNTLTSVPSKMRILLLDACRNNPFPEINKTAGHGLAIVDAKTGAPGTFVSFSTSPGAEAEDGNGNDSPYTTALLTVAKEPGLPIEETFKRVRVSVNKATEGRQTPWDSSSLTDDFSFVAGPDAATAPGGPKAATAPKQGAVKRTVEEWKRDLSGKPVVVANEMIVGDGSEEAYEAFVALYTQPPFGPQARQWLDRHRRMVAWNIAVITNTAAGYRAFLAQYPDSDLAATARKLEERLRNRPNIAAAVAAIAGGAAGGSGSTPPNASSPINASLPGPTCPCNTEPPPLKKVDVPKLKDSKPPKRADKQPPKRVRESDDNVAVYRRPPPPDYYEPSGPSIGIGIGGGGFGGGGFGRGGGGGMMPGRRY